MHAWDVAVTIGIPWEPVDELVAASLKATELVSTDPAERGPGLAFDQVVPAPAASPPKDRLLALLGRIPTWTPPAGGPPQTASR